MSTRIVAVYLVLALLTCSAVHAQGRDRTDLWRSYAKQLPPHALVVLQMKNAEWRFHSFLYSLCLIRRVPVPRSSPPEEIRSKTYALKKPSCN